MYRFIKCFVFRRCNVDFSSLILKHILTNDQNLFKYLTFVLIKNNCVSFQQVAQPCFAKVKTIEVPCGGLKNASMTAMNMIRSTQQRTDRDQCCSGDDLSMHSLYMETRRQKFKRQLPESQLVQEDPEKVVQENWSKKRRSTFHKVQNERIKQVKM